LATQLVRPPYALRYVGLRQSFVFNAYGLEPAPFLRHSAATTRLRDELAFDYDGLTLHLPTRILGVQGQHMTQLTLIKCRPHRRQTA